MKFQTPNGPPYTRVSCFTFPRTVKRIVDAKEIAIPSQTNRPNSFLHAHFQDNIAPPSHVFTTTFIFNARPIISGIDRPQKRNRRRCKLQPISRTAKLIWIRIAVESILSSQTLAPDGSGRRGYGMQPCVAVQIKTKYSSTETTGFS